MKRIIAVILILFTMGAIAQNVDETAAIKEAVLNYIQGAYSGDGARMEKSLYPGLNKVMVALLPKGGEMLSYSTFDQLIEGANAKLMKVPEDQWNIEVKVLKIHDNIASAKVTSALFTDFVNLGKTNGKWCIVNVLWIPKQLIKGTSRPDDKENIKQTALDYVDGFYSSNTERLLKGIHESLHKVVARKLPNGREYFQRIDRLSLVQYAKAGIGGAPEDKRSISIEILDVLENMALVSIPSARFIDLVQMAYINGKWRIVNVIWTPRPAK